MKTSRNFSNIYIFRWGVREKELDREKNSRERERKIRREREMLQVDSNEE